MAIYEALGLIAVYGALVAAVLFILMVVVGELVVIVRWLRRISRMEPPTLRAGMRRW
jgi:hypothetical protein